MKLGLHLANFTYGVPTAELAASSPRSSSAEAAGFDRLSVMDHYFQIPHVGPAENEMFEAYNILGYIAAKTSRLKLGVLATGVTYRNPGFLAKQVAGLDVLSGGRAWLGIGAAWFEREHEGLGFAFPPLASASNAGRSHPDLRADVERRQRPLRGQALPAERDALLPEAPPAAPAPNPARRQRRAEDSAPGRSLRRCLQRPRRRPGEHRSGCSASWPSTAAPRAVTRGYREDVRHSFDPGPKANAQTRRLSGSRSSRRLASTRPWVSSSAARTPRHGGNGDQGHPAARAVPGGRAAPTLSRLQAVAEHPERLIAQLDYEPGAHGIVRRQVGLPKKASLPHGGGAVPSGPLTYDKSIDSIIEIPCKIDGGAMETLTISPKFQVVIPKAHP